MKKLLFRITTFAVLFVALATFAHFAVAQGMNSFYPVNGINLYQEADGDYVLKDKVGGTTIGQLSNTGALTVPSQSISGNLTFTAASAKIIPGATSLLIRNNADDQTNVSITNAGVLTARAGLVATAGGLTLTAGNIVLGGTTQNLGTSSAYISQAFATDWRATNGTVTGTFQASGGGTLIFGATSAHDLDVYARNARRLLLSDTTAGFTTAITSSATGALGWSVVAAANQACTTTCTFAAMGGQDTGTGAIVGPSDATADLCYCAGAS